MKRKCVNLFRSAAVGLTAVLVASLSTLSVEPARAAEPVTTVAIKPNPSYGTGEFEGWGTSLVWFANATGGYPDALRQELFDKVFSAEGMNLNIARYNVGGGNASDVPNYLRYGAAVDGWWAPNDDPAAGPLSTYDQRSEYLKTWDPYAEDSYDWAADETQRWWLESAAKSRDDMVWEAFSNSPPYFMTNSGFVTGNFRSSDEQLSTQDNAPTKFAVYLAKVVSFLQEEYGIEFSSIDPFNEPCTGYWGTSIPDGQKWPNWGNTTQEGAQICPGPGEGQQQSVIDKLTAALERESISARVSANDETNPGNFNSAWNKYGQTTRDQVGQINVHTYGTNGILEARDIAKANDKALWMSEVGGDFLHKTDENGQTIREFDPVHFSAAVGFAQKVISDLQDLQPNNYVFWQEIEDYYNMQNVERLNWGSIFIDFDCNDTEETAGYSTRRLNDAEWQPGQKLPEEAKCQIVTNSKYNAMRNFTHYITPGSTIIPTNDRATIAATKDDNLTMVHVNGSASAQNLLIDLTGFDKVAAGSVVTPIITTQAPDAQHLEDTALIEGEPVKVGADKRAQIRVPAMSVVTLLVDSVSGVAEGSALIEDGGTYQLANVKSGLALTATDGKMAIEPNADTGLSVQSQLWVFHQLEDAAVSKAERYLITTPEGHRLVGDKNGLRIDSSGRSDDQDSTAVWILNTVDGKTISLLNEKTAQVLDVSGESTKPGASVGLWTSSGGAHQSWIAKAVELRGFAPQAVRTMPGVVPTLPTTIVPLYRWGAGDPVPVSWDLSTVEWDKAGSNIVKGKGTDLYGNDFDDAHLTIDIGVLDSTDPISVTVGVGTKLDDLRTQLPTVVTGRQNGSEGQHLLPVNWDLSGLPQTLDATGEYDVVGTIEASDNGGKVLLANLRIFVTPVQLTNILTEDGVSSSASYYQTEYGSYGPERTHNGDRTQKGWSTWGPGRTYESDYLQYVLPEQTTLSEGAVYFYRDGSNRSWSDTVKVHKAEGDKWVEIGEFPVGEESDGIVSRIDFDGVTTESLRLQFDAPNYLTVAEVEAYSPVASPANNVELAALRVGGQDLLLQGQKDTYEVTIAGVGTPTISAVALDPAAQVEVIQNGDDIVVMVTSADGSQRRIINIALIRSVDLRSVWIEAEGYVGEEMTAHILSYPEAEDVDFQWYKNGEAIEGAAAATYRVGKADAGSLISVAARGHAQDFLSSQWVTSHADGDGVEVAELSADNTLGALLVGGVPIDGFTAGQLSYEVVSQGSQWPVVTATASDPEADVRVDFDPVTGIAVIRVTAPNDEVREYSVVIKRQVVVRSVTISGDPFVGETLSTEVATDPLDAEVSYVWTIDMARNRSGNTGSTLLLLPEHYKASVGLSVVASAEGYLSASEAAIPVVVDQYEEPLTGPEAGGGSQVHPGAGQGATTTKPGALAESGLNSLLIPGALLVSALVLGGWLRRASCRRKQ